jgi:hypothetical protein
MGNRPCGSNFCLLFVRLVIFFEFHKEGKTRRELSGKLPHQLTGCGFEKMTTSITEVSE